MRFPPFFFPEATRFWVVCFVFVVFLEAALFRTSQVWGSSMPNPAVDKLEVQILRLLWSVPLGGLKHFLARHLALLKKTLRIPGDSQGNLSLLDLSVCWFVFSSGLRQMEFVCFKGSILRKTHQPPHWGRLKRDQNWGSDGWGLQDTIGLQRDLEETPKPLCSNLKLCIAKTLP